ncbi:hypothetical protein [Nocardia xishanensis]|uniref:Class I SAM-dependent methyltransferase n=1 Tax=Nocardia xishanensis TaxID=238964 RepID=A0ABW7WW46_9NOCA
MTMTDSLEHSNGGPFTGTAWHYARYRPSYPDVFIDDVIQSFGLDGTGCLLDLGCGTGPRHHGRESLSNGQFPLGSTS